MKDKKICVGILLDYTTTAPFLIQIASLLHKTGKVQPILFQCRDKASYPETEFQLISFSDDSRERPEHPYDISGIVAYEEYLIQLRVDEYFKDRTEHAALGLLAQAERYFRENRVDCLLVWGGTRLGIRAVVAAGRRCGIPTVFMETPYFQRVPYPSEQTIELTLARFKNKVLIWDTIQAPQCGPSQLSRDWTQYTIQPGLGTFLDNLRKERISKFSREDIKGNLAASGIKAKDCESITEYEFFKPPQTRALLVLGQTDHDSSMFFNEHHVRCWHDLGVEIAKRLPPGWIIWFKGHPLETRYVEGIESFAHELHAINPRCRILPTMMDIHLCYQACDAIACINSTSTLEASIYEIPVINLGKGAFTHIGMTYTITDLEQLEGVIAGLPKKMTQEQIEVRDRFLSYVFYQYLIPVGSPNKMLSRIQQAITENKDEKQ